METVPFQIPDFPHKHFKVQTQENELHQEVEKFVNNLQEVENLSTI